MSRIKLDKENINSKPSAYIMSSGGQTTKARGFALLRLAKKYILILSTKDRQWKLEAKDLPEGWFNLAFTWENKKLLKLFINGKVVASAKAMKTLRPEDSYTTMTIGKPNNSPMKKHRMPLSMDKLALWERALSEHEIKNLGYQGTTKVH
jgi:hypothetical protein